jgi:hypothetical protein
VNCPNAPGLPRRFGRGLLLAAWRSRSSTPRTRRGSRPSTWRCSPAAARAARPGREAGPSRRSRPSTWGTRNSSGGSASSACSPRATRRPTGCSATCWPGTPTAGPGGGRARRWPRAAGVVDAVAQLFGSPARVLAGRLATAGRPKLRSGVDSGYCLWPQCRPAYSPDGPGSSGTRRPLCSDCPSGETSGRSPGPGCTANSPARRPIRNLNRIWRDFIAPSHCSWDNIFKPPRTNRLPRVPTLPRAPR